MATRELDVAILGGGLAGLTLARQLRRALPAASIEVFERAEDRSHKVGESTVEIAGSYLTRRLGLTQYLYDQQLPKNGLRFFFDRPEKDAHLFEMSELGTRGLPTLPSFQLDRARMENDLIAMNRASNVPVHLGCPVRELLIDERSFAHDEEQIRARFIVDATGRASLVARALDLRTEEDHPLSAVWARYKSVAHLDDLPEKGRKWDAWRARVRHTARYLSTNHFCYRGYWIWFIPLGRGITSVGWVGEHALFEEAMRKEEGFRKFLDGHRAVRELLEGAELVDIGSYKQLAYGTKQFFGERWSCVGEAGAFSDPFYSPGSDFIAIENDLTTDLIVRTMRGERDVAERRRLYEELVQFRFRATMLLYQNLYSTFGCFDLLRLKWNFDVASYYNVWVDSYVRDTHLDTTELRSHLRFKNGILEAMAAFSRMFQSIGAELERTGRYHEHNLGHFSDSMDVVGDLARDPSPASVLQTTVRIFDFVRARAEELAGPEHTKEVREVVRTFERRAFIQSKIT